MIPIVDVRAWDPLVLSLPAPHVLQSATWGEFKQRWGWTVRRFAWEGPAGPSAAAQVLVRPVAGLPLRVAYIARGPILREPRDPSAWLPVIDDLARWARRERAAVLKMDPDVPADARDVREAWLARGWKPSAEQIQFPNTMRSDLTVGEEALRARMRHKTRYNLGLATRRGVTVRRAGASELPAFFDLYAETAGRDGFAIRELSYYLDIWSTWLAAGRAALILAGIDGDALAGAMPVAYGPTAWYLYGASATRGRENMAAYLAQWESLRWAAEQGCRTYDWWGGPTRLDPSDGLWGVYRFKLGFGAVWNEQLGAWDGPTSPLPRRVYEVLSHARRAHLSRRRAVRFGGGMKSP